MEQRINPNRDFEIKDISQDAIDAMAEAKQIHMQYQIASNSSNNSMMMQGSYQIPDMLSPDLRYAPMTDRRHGPREFDMGSGGKRNSSGKRTLKKGATLEMQGKCDKKSDSGSRCSDGTKNGRRTWVDDELLR